jgi:transposase-like protein
MLRRTTEPTYLRFELVRNAREHGIKPAAREFGTTVKTVRKWLRRWEPGSLRGLEDRSRGKSSPADSVVRPSRSSIACRLGARLG